MKKLVIFDLDGTLAESKSPLAPEMGALLIRLLATTRVAIISGGDWPQFERQLLSGLPVSPWLDRLYLLPTCGTKFFERQNGLWTALYREDLAEADKQYIINALQDALDHSGLRPEKTWGEVIEDRGSQITMSVLGQQAPVAEKTAWDPDFSKRAILRTLLDRSLGAFSVRMGGTTSIDVTRKGIDKGYGIRNLCERLNVTINDMIFIGDALFPGGNDYAVKQAGVDSIRINTPRETMCIIEAILYCLGAERDGGVTPP